MTSLKLFCRRKVFNRSLNLVDNAVAALSAKENGPDEQKINVIIKTVENNDLSCIKIEVIDNGIGMPKEIIEKSQDIFFTTKRPSEGINL